MNRGGRSRRVAMYPKGWRAENGDALDGMLRDVAEQHPERVSREVAGVVAQGFWRSVRWPLAYLLAAMAMAAAVGALFWIGVGGLGAYAQALGFLVSPVLSALALGIAYGARLSVLRFPWLPAGVGAAGLAIAGSAHLVWWVFSDDGVGRPGASVRR